MLRWILRCLTLSFANCVSILLVFWCVGKVWNHFIFTSNNHRKLSPLTAWPHKPTSESTSWFSAFSCKQNVQKTRWDFLSWILFTPTLIICDFDQPQHLSPATLQHRSQATLTQLYHRMRHWSMISPQHWSLSVDIITSAMLVNVAFRYMTERHFEI